MEIFQIQRFCLEDGDGIRTTVFLKGCPLNCIWCHNPEGKRTGRQLAFQKDRCISCGRCQQACRQNAHLVEEGRHRICYEDCNGCGACVALCPVGCLEIVGREVGADALAEELLKDRPFWEGGGGVTFSGGEPLYQADGVYETGRRLKEQNCHIMVETSGYGSREAVKKVMQITDGWLFDFKAGPSRKHEKLCGQGNERIRENFSFLCQNGCRLIMRYPLVPGVNDDAEDFAVLLGMLKETSMEIPVQIMPYHIMGKDKAARTGQIYPAFLPQENADKTYIAQKKRQLRGMGIKVY